MKKVLSVILVLIMAASFAAVGTVAEAKGPVKIGVLVADVSGEEALGFRAYYEDYIAKNYDVTFTYTEQLADAAAEKSAIEKFAAQGYKAILSLSSADRATQIETCANYGMYYAVVSGMMDDTQFEQYKGSEYFVGQIGPSMDTEFEAGYAMGKYFADQGAKTVGIYGAFIPNPMHVYRTAGVLAGLGCTYGGASDKDGIAGQLFGDQGVDMSKLSCGDTQVIGYFQGFGDTTFDELFAIIGQAPDAFLSVGMATTFFADALNGAKIPYSDIDSFTSGNAANMADGTLTYLAGKYSSSIGPIFAATLNAVNGNLIRDAEGNALSVSQSYLVATDSETFDSIFNGDKGDSPIFSKEVLDSVIGENISFEEFVALVESR
ncbi:MAG: sugar ABC transporter substrate-binding protein [Acutalibacteraceae bacterium]|nr:sugar ABC transporter substrate-binding protein [Acutalibacteraceae bacterium]